MQKESDDLVKCSRCGSVGDTFVLCSGCHTPIEVTALRAQLAAAEARDRQTSAALDAECENKYRLVAERLDLLGQLETAKKALEEIADWCPATQEMTLAHQMADVAEDALRSLQPDGGK